jgi:hypothetical protein
MKKVSKLESIIFWVGFVVAIWGILIALNCILP